MEKLSLVCEQCGSVEVELIDSGIAKCSHCGTKFLIVSKKSKNRNDSAWDFEPIQGVYAIKPIKDIETFKRNAIVDLLLSDSAPLDISEATFGEPYENITQSLIITVFYDGECIADIGYRHSFASKYSFDDSDFMWEPFTRAFRTDVKSTLPLDKGAHPSEFRRPNLIAEDTFLSCMKGKLDADKYICSMGDLGVAPAELTEDIINEAIKDNEGHVSSNIDLPGDNQKIVSVTARHKVVSLIRVAEKQYILPGEYKGEKFELVASSGGLGDEISICKRYSSSYFDKGCYKFSELGIKRADNKAWEGESEAEMKLETYTKAREKENKRVRGFATFTGIAGVVACAYSFLIGAPIVALSVAGYELFKKARNKHWEKRIEPCKKEIADSNPLKLSKKFLYKLKKLEECLAEKGLDPVTDSEIERYSNRRSYGIGRY